ncbi:MAG: glutathione S-transferase family protein [Spirochaetota bacterium]
MAKHLPMIELHGFPISNYYNRVKLTLLERDIAFEEFRAAPSHKEEFLQNSPMGRIPFVKIGDVTLYESLVILEYLEELYPDKPSLFPKDLQQKAVCRQVIAVTDLYLDTSLRNLNLFSANAKEPEETAKKKALATIALAVDALGKLCSFQTYALGEELSYADIAAATTWEWGREALQKLAGEDILLRMDGYGEYIQHLRERPAVKKVLRAQKAAIRARNMANR